MAALLRWHLDRRVVEQVLPAEQQLVYPRSIESCVTSL